jgi:hypothetical protein
MGRDKHSAASISSVFVRAFGVCDRLNYAVVREAHVSVLPPSSVGLL